MRGIITWLSCVLTLVSTALVGTAAHADPAPTVRFLSRFGEYGTVSGIITLRVSLGTTSCQFGAPPAQPPIHLLMLDVRPPGGPQQTLSPTNANCDGNLVRYEIDTSALAEDHPYVVNLYDVNWQFVDQVRFTPHNHRDQVKSPLPKGVYVTGGWTETNVNGAFTYIEDGSQPAGYKVPGWVSGIAVVLGWNTLQQDGPNDLRTARIADALAYARAQQGRTLPLVVIIEVGDKYTPDWYVKDAADGFGQRVVRYQDGTGEAFGFTPWDTLAGDMFNNATARLAALFDNDPNFGGIYIGGAGTPRYPEMWYSRFTGCNGQYVRDEPLPAKPGELPKANGWIDGRDFTWTDPCPSLAPDPARQAAAWLQTYRLMSSQFPKSQLIGMLDVTRESDDPNHAQRTTAAMHQILTAPSVAGKQRQPMGVTNLSPRTFDTDDRSYKRDDYLKYDELNAAANIFRFNEVSPNFYRIKNDSENTDPYMPEGLDVEQAKFGTDSHDQPIDYRLRLQDVVESCDAEPAGGATEFDGQSYVFTVQCDAILVHRSNLDPSYNVHDWVFDRCTLSEASTAVWQTVGPSCGGNPADAIAPPPWKREPAP